ncbi:MAG: cytochrome c [Deltaproteobacteria bacterium]|nr:cytochrome c [Deltaproteobacteria bacterium]
MRALVIAALVAAPALARASESPAIGDVHRGAELYRLNCVACHGGSGQGDGFMAKSLDPKPGVAKGTPLLVTLTDANLHDLLHDGGGAMQLSKTMPAFGKELSELELWDVIAFLRQGSYDVLDFFPNGGRYLVKSYTLDPYAQERLTKAGVSASGPAANIEVVTVFNGDRQPGAPATLEPQDPVTLDSLKPKDRIGYVAFVSGELPGDSKPLPIAIAMDREGKITKAVSLAGTDDARRDKLMASFVGQGKKGPHVPLEAPKAEKKSKKPAKAAAPTDAKLSGFDAAYALAMEAVTMYDKEERDRTWADAPSSK